MGIDLDGFTEELQALIQYALQCGLDRKELVRCVNSEAMRLHENQPEYDQ